MGWREAESCCVRRVKGTSPNVCGAALLYDSVTRVQTQCESSVIQRQAAAKSKLVLMGK